MTQIGLELIILFSLFIGSAVALLGIAVYGIIKWWRKINMNNINMKDLENLKLLIQKWATDRNLHTADSSKQALKLGEEYGELCEGIGKGKTHLVKDALGDMFVVMVILAMQEDLDVAECVGMAYYEIKDRKGKMIDGVFVKEADIDDEVHR